MILVDKVWKRWLPTIFCVIWIPKKSKGELKWEVYKKIAEYGEEVVLFCNAPGCCSDSAGWNRLNSPIFLNIANLRYNESTKYDARYGQSGFFLFIRQFSKEDVNVTYSCTYGFKISNPSILNTAMVFRDSTESKVGCPYVTEQKEIYVISTWLLGFATAFLLIVAFLLVFKSYIRKGINTSLCCPTSSQGVDLNEHHEEVDFERTEINVHNL